jgi:hypothetical protein
MNGGQTHLSNSMCINNKVCANEGDAEMEEVAPGTTKTNKERVRGRFVKRAVTP